MCFTRKIVKIRQRLVVGDRLTVVLHDCMIGVISKDGFCWLWCFFPQNTGMGFYPSLAGAPWR